MENTTVEHKVALVTGGARGLGRAIVLELANAGYDVVINYNKSEKQAYTLLKELEKKGVCAFLCQADITDEDQVKDMINKSIEMLGKIDVLINNSAVCIDSLFQDKQVEDFKKTLDTNVIGTFLVSKYVGQTMYDNKYGRIINITSTNGINTYFPMCIDYDASKSAIISLTHNLAVQFAPYVNVNAVAPGFIATETEMEGMDEDFIKLEEEKILVKRVGQPEEVAKLIRFLASEDASFINNQVIKINGGFYGDV